MLYARLTNDMRQEFIHLYKEKMFCENDTIEIPNAHFIADEESIFGELNLEYAHAEMVWYLSQSLNVDDIPGTVPKIWRDVSDEQGFINSNYGWCIFSDENHNQYLKAVDTLLVDKSSRQAQMIYTRPTMHEDSKANGMKDFMCTSTTQLLIRNDRLHYFVSMRSSDAVFGYKNDRFWHNQIHGDALRYLKVVYPDLILGNLYWHAVSLHVYPRHYKLIEEAANDQS